MRFGTVGEPFPPDQSLLPRHIQRLASYGNVVTCSKFVIFGIEIKCSIEGLVSGIWYAISRPLPLTITAITATELSLLLRIQLPMNEKTLSIANGTDRTIAVHY